MPTSKRLNVAVVGATGLVGNEMLRVLGQRQFPTDRIVALASERSKGLTVAYNGSSIKVEELSESAFKGIDVALFAASGDIALMYGPAAAESGALVIDNSSAWRMKENVPLVVPEVNGDDIRENEGIIANPNCCAIPLTVVLNPIRKELAYNVVPGGWRLEADGYNEEEVKIVNETRKILHETELKITATCVRVPVPIGHGESLFVETVEKLTADDARTLLGNAPGIIVQDDPQARLYPTPQGVAGKDEVYVGRIREDASTKFGLALWIVSDNLRKGAALNAVQIAEQAIEMGVLGAVRA